MNYRSKPIKCKIHKKQKIRQDNYKKKKMFTALINSFISTTFPLLEL